MSSSVAPKPQFYLIDYRKRSSCSLLRRLVNTVLVLFILPAYFLVVSLKRIAIFYYSCY